MPKRSLEPLDERLALRLSSPLKDEIEADAAASGRSVNAHLLWLYGAWSKAGKPAELKPKPKRAPKKPAE